MKRKKCVLRNLSVALAGNPNVGKSTLFNSLTGMHRHTGNWAGKTVSIATADVKYNGKIYSVADIPGTYSLLSHSEEEEIARNYICFGGADLTVVVCDATSLERSLGLVLQIKEVTNRVIVVVNLMDEAKKSGIKIDTDALASILGVSVVGVVARKRKSLSELLRVLDSFEEREEGGYSVKYSDAIEDAVKCVEESLEKIDTGGISHRWLALRLIESDENMSREIFSHLGIAKEEDAVREAVLRASEILYSHGIDPEHYKDEIVGRILSVAEDIGNRVTEHTDSLLSERSFRIDRVLTGRFTAFPFMILLLGFVVWITAFLASYPSDALIRCFNYLEGKLLLLLRLCCAPEWLTSALISGVYKTTATVVAVMLPPMAIFFPMFTLLEDSGYLPRIAYNLDRPFAACGACGKQALTMCMGLGCNAVGITGARIIDSKRERLIAILTNSLVPCNGRFPMLLSIIGVFSVMLFGRESSLVSVGVMLLLILLSVGVTFLCTLLLSKTLLRGERSSFTIELPPYRRPEVIRVILRSFTTKVVSVLGRAVAVAAPMGLLIFILSNLNIEGKSLVLYASEFLEPLGRVMGLDGKILLAFILGLPANEIVVPILIMLYTSGSSFGADIGVSAMYGLFSDNGWSVVTVVCMALFALFHSPCSTSIITVYKETKSKKYTALATLLPIAVGMLLCIAVNLFSKLCTN